MKRQTIYNILASLVLLAFFVGGAMLYRSTNDGESLSSVRVNLHQTTDIPYLTEHSIGSRVEYLIDSLGTDMIAIESDLRAVPYAENIQVFRAMDGACVVDVRQHNPALRFLTSTGYDFYVDADLNILPTPDEHYFSTPTITGDLSFSLPPQDFLSPSAKNSLQDIVNIKILLNFVNIIQSDPFLRDFITQIYVNAQGELILTPRLTGVRIMLGELLEGVNIGVGEYRTLSVETHRGGGENTVGEVDSVAMAQNMITKKVVSEDMLKMVERVNWEEINDGMRERLAKLKFICQRGFPQSWWTAISEIDLRYKNQVVVTKKDSKSGASSTPRS